MVKSSLDAKETLFLKSVLENLPGNVFWKDKDGKFLGCNKNVSDVLGLSSPDEIFGKKNYQLFDENLAALADENDRKAFTDRTEIEFVEVGIGKNGKPAIYLSRKIPLFDEENNIIGLLGVSFDITELKETQEKLLAAENRLQAMTLLATSIAHELRTPLLSIDAVLMGIREEVAHITESYLSVEEATRTNLVNKDRLQELPIELGRLRQKLRNTFTLLDIILVKLNESRIERATLEVCSMAQCVNTALKEYPFDHNERVLVSLEVQQDFEFRGNELLVKHVLFNLLKNAIHYVRAAGKGDIKISISQSEELNLVRFKDTGTGMSPTTQSRVFEKFFSQTRHGTGVGLAFCKSVMQHLNGDIVCTSVEGEYTEFVMSFPRIT